MPVVKKVSESILKSQSIKTHIPSRLSPPLAATIPVSQGPSPAYLESVDSPPTQTLDPLNIAQRRKHLLILDLNGTLVSRTKKRNAMFVRPHIDAFLDYIFDNFRVMVWSSAQATSVHHMLYLFGEERKKKLLKVWNRAHFGLSPKQFNNKAATIKDLARVWKRHPKYNAHSTVILDDSPSKSVLQPFNSIHITTFEQSSDDFLANGDHELLSVIDYLKRLRLQTNIPNFMRNTPYASIRSSSSHQTLDPEQRRESKVCYYYGFFNDQVVQRWDFSDKPATVENLGPDNDETTDSEATDKDGSDSDGTFKEDTDSDTT